MASRRIPPTWNHTLYSTQHSWLVYTVRLALSSVGSFLSGIGKFSYVAPLAAYFVQSTFSAYEKHVESSPQDQDEPGKEASNLIVLVSELYNFQVISCILIYDVVRDLLNQPQLSEYTVELLLKIVKSKHP